MYNDDKETVIEVHLVIIFDLSDFTMQYIPDMQHRQIIHKVRSPHCNN